MQFGIFGVGDVTPEPHTGVAPTEHDRIHSIMRIAQHAEEVGLDVFATGEHRRAAISGCPLAGSDRSECRIRPILSGR